MTINDLKANIYYIHRTVLTLICCMRVAHLAPQFPGTIQVKNVYLRSHRNGTVTHRNAHTGRVLATHHQHIIQVQVSSQKYIILKYLLL